MEADVNGSGWANPSCLFYFDFTVVEKSFEMAPPKVSPEKQVLVDKGLEGKV